MQWVIPNTQPFILQIKPLYELLHAYVRRRLREAYGPERISRSAPIPAHILGDMWGQSWSGIVPFTLPYPGKKMVDVTPEMVQQVMAYFLQVLILIKTKLNLSFDQIVIVFLQPELWKKL